MAELDEKGREILDQTPVEVPLRVRRLADPSHVDNIRRAVREEISMQAAQEGFETFEEADDFDIPDDGGEFHSPYELTDMQEEFPIEPPATPDPDQGLGEPPADKESTDDASVVKPSTGSKDDGSSKG